MQHIIITVRDPETPQGAELDLEVPVSIPGEQLLDDITQALYGYDPFLLRDVNKTVLYDPQRGQLIRGDQTLEDAGVVNGDYLELRSSR